MRTKSAKQTSQPRRGERRPDGARPWLNTIPRGNGEIDLRTLNRGFERFEAVLGR